MKTRRARQLILLQLADSALPIGAAAHSFGLETLVSEGILTIANLELFLCDYLIETGTQEGAFCRASYRLAAENKDDRAFSIKGWLELNLYLSARKTACESRIASATLGRRFLQLVIQSSEHLLLKEAAQAAKQSGIDTHHCAAFGFTGGVFELDEDAAVLAYLQQSITGLVSVCQRLLPLGQTQAHKILWNLRPVLAEAGLSKNSQLNCDEVYSFTPLLDLGAMRHPSLATRLFIS